MATAANGVTEKEDLSAHAGNDRIFDRVLMFLAAVSFFLGACILGPQRRTLCGINEQFFNACKSGFQFGWAGKFSCG